MSELTNEITLVLGDWSDDGHGKTDIQIIRSNLDHKALLKAYNKGSKKLGFNFIDDDCADYEDGSLPRDHLVKLMEHGLKLEDIFDTDYDLKKARDLLEDEQSEDGIGLWVDSFSAIFLFIAKLGNKDFEYGFVREGSRLNIGGYGLFQ
jgi:hypothetical protein